MISIYFSRNMRIKEKLLISIVLLSLGTVAQKVSSVYKSEQLLKRLSSPDTIYVVNFWATWCKPCVEELPVFNQLLTNTTGQPIKILLVNLDFKEKLSKVNTFLKKNKIHT